MLSNIASYLGYVSSSTSSTSATEAQSRADRADVRLSAVDEDDWVLVERNEKLTSATDAEDMTRVTLAISTCPSSLPGSSKALSKSTLLEVPCHLQESWYLTPPPSFISEGPVYMETSPLENLLIEHPSMSVYKHTQRRKSSNCSPPSTSPSSVIAPRPPSPPRLAQSLTHTKLNTKFSNISTNRTTKNEQVNSKNEEKVEELKETKELKEPKMKTFVKSPRRSINAFPKRINRRNEEPGTMSAQEQSSAIPAVQRKLYSEVLASKSKVQQVQVQFKSEEKSESEVSQASVESPMSVEEASENVEAAQRNEIETDRRRSVQTMSEQQQRQHFLSRSAQKVCSHLAITVSQKPIHFL